MSKKHSIASKARWANIPEEIRKQKMSILAHKRHDNMTSQEKLKIGQKLNSFRWKGHKK